MLKFNNNHIFTGYLKQLLSSFDLPSCRIYTKEHALYKKINGEESPEIIMSIISYVDPGTGNKTYPKYIPYLKDNYIQIYYQNPKTKEKCWKIISNYYDWIKNPNNYRRLKVQNNIYDAYTHAYLGDYLRFLRDYAQLDLMPLYNCFNNKLVSLVNIKTLNLDAAKETNIPENVTFKNWTNSNYKIYAIPIKFFKEYTIAIECESSIETFCGLYNKYLDTSTLNIDLITYSYQQYNNLKFNEPILYTKLLRPALRGNVVNNLADYILREEELNLFICIPPTVTSSIVILEGDYQQNKAGWLYTKTTTVPTEKNVIDDSEKVYHTITWHQYIDNKVWVQNSTVTNFEDVLFENNQALRPYWVWTEDNPKKSKNIITKTNYEKNRTFKPVTPLTLLQYNTGISYPFSNKLIEYLSDNVITHLDEIQDNIKRTQTAVQNNLPTNTDTDTPTITLDLVDDEVDNFWDPRITSILYEYMQNKYKQSPENVEIFGYVDKTVDKLYAATLFNKIKKRFEKTSISNIDLYPEIYKDSK